MMAMACVAIYDEVLFVHDYHLLWGGFERFREVCRHVPRHHEFALILLQLNVAFTSCQTVVVILLKTAILWEWIRIFVPGRTKNWFYWLSISTIVMNFGIYISGFFIANFSCTPRQRIFRAWMTNVGYCMPGQAEAYRTIGVLNLVGHIMIILLPQPIIWRLQLTLKRRLGISVIFSLGIL
jgi:hypothetical protein